LELILEIAPLMKHDAAMFFKGFGKPHHVRKSKANGQRSIDELFWQLRCFPRGRAMIQGSD
jgi:hypothetical protein